MNIKKIWILVFLPFIYLFFSVYRTTERDYVEVGVGFKGAPQITEIIDIKLYREGREIDDEVEVFDFLDKVYIFNLKPTNYTLKFFYDEKEKSLDFIRKKGYQRLPDQLFEFSKFDRKRTTFMYATFTLIIIFLTIVAFMTGQRGYRYLRISAILVIIILTLRIFNLATANLEWMPLRKIYKISYLGELFVAFALMRTALEKPLNLYSKKSVAAVVQGFFIMQVLATGLFTFMETGRILEIVFKAKNLFLMKFFYINLEYISDLLFPVVSLIILSTSLAIFFKTKVKKRRYWEGTFVFLASLVTILGTYYNFYSFPDRRMDGIVGIYVFFGVFIITLMRSSVLLESKRYSWGREIFWFSFRFTVITSLAYLYLIYTRDLKWTIIGLASLVAANVVYIILEKLVESQQLTFQKLIVKGAGASNISQLKKIIEKGIEETIPLEEIHLKIDVNGFQEVQEREEEINIYGKINGRRIVSLRIKSSLELRGFEIKALDELMEMIPSLILIVHQKELESKRYSRDNFSLGTKIMELRNLMELEDKIEDTEKKLLIRSTLFRELDKLEKEVERDV